MITPELQKKIDFAIRLLKSYDDEKNPVEIAFSGGKDSEVILQLAKEAGIHYRAIYRNTTIDPPGTIKHVREKGVEVLRPETSFFGLITKMGYPNRFMRFCCRYLKEKKVLDKCVLGVRKAESRKRNERYNEPTECKFYGSKKEHVEAIYPILTWTDADVLAYIEDRNIQLHPLYYDKNGQIDITRRLGCMGCPLKSKYKRIKDFKENPALLRAYIRFGRKYMELHPEGKTVSQYKDIYEWFFRDLFAPTQKEWAKYNDSMFENDYKAMLEKYFNTTL